MLGRFLEFSIPTPDIGASLAFYERLGFSQAEVGEAWTHPYAVLTDGRLCLGLHQSDANEAVLTFVRPDLLKSMALIEQQGVAFEYLNLSNDVFNELAWRDPSGHLLRLVEARTFSPSKRPASDQSACGYFREIALPAHEREAAKMFWERWGFVAIDETEGPLPHTCCTSDTIDVGLYEPGQISRPTLLFGSEDPSADVAALGHQGIFPVTHLPAMLRGAAVTLFTAPEGTPILIAAEPRPA